jgi:prepilin-type N-terminal cleavage/methylation domain-containing protein
MENHIEIEETKQDKGFTLVELLIVIVILGILATVTVFAVTGITTRGKDSACKSDVKTIQTAEEAYNANTGAYGTEAQLVSGGLMHGLSSNFDVVPVAATSVALANYTITIVNTTDCAGTPLT